MPGSAFVNAAEVPRRKREGMDNLKKFVQKDRFAKHLGIEMLEYGGGRARARMTVVAHHLNSAGTVHGGAIFSLADAAFSAASNSHGSLALAINVSISFFKAVRDGVLVAEAREASFNPRLATYLINVTDQDSNAVALFQGTVYRKKDSIAEIVK
jgi:acyl-CoA thioesterase